MSMIGKRCPITACRGAAGQRVSFGIGPGFDVHSTACGTCPSSGHASAVSSSSWLVWRAPRPFLVSVCPEAFVGVVRDMIRYDAIRYDTIW